MPIAVVVALAGLLWCVPSATAGVTRTVCPAGPPACDFASIQAAIDASLDEDVVQVAPARYDEQVVVDRLVTVQGPGYGFDALVDPTTALNAYTIAGDGSGPPLSITSGGVVVGAVISGGIGDDVPGVAFPAPAVPLAAGARTATLRNSIVHGNTIGIRATVGSASLVQDVRVAANTSPGVGTGQGVVVAGARFLQTFRVRIEGNPVAGVATVDGAASQRLVVSSTEITDASVGIAAVDVDDVDVTGGRIDVPASGTGIRVDAARSWIQAADIRGGGRSATVGVELVGGPHARESVDSSSFDGLDTSILVGSPSPTESTAISGNLFRDSDVAPIHMAVARSAWIGRNFVACPAASCPSVRGIGAGSANVDDLVPAMWFTDHYGRDERLTEVTAGESAFLWVGFVDSAGTPYEFGWAFSSPLHGALATVTGAAGVEAHGSWRMGESDWFTTGAPGERVTLTGHVFGRPFASPTLRLVGSTPSPTTYPSIDGDGHVGSRLICHPGTWPEPPTTLTYRWTYAYEVASPTLGTTPAYTATSADYDRGPLQCNVYVTFENYPPSESNAEIAVRQTRLVARLLPLGRTWRVMRCGTTLRRPCASRRRVGVRFALSTNSRLKATARIQLERRVRGGWRRWVKGTIPHPSRSGWVIPGKLVGPGTYRLRLVVPGHRHFSSANTRWSYWRVR